LLVAEREKKERKKERKKEMGNGKKGTINAMR